MRKLVFASGAVSRRSRSRQIFYPMGAPFLGCRRNRNRSRFARKIQNYIAMTFVLPENIATRPIAILGAGTLGSRIALMLATRGAEVRLFSRGATTREEGIAFAKE